MIEVRFERWGVGRQQLAECNYKVTYRIFAHAFPAGNITPPNNSITQLGQAKTKQVSTIEKLVPCFGLSKL